MGIGVLARVKQCLPVCPGVPHDEPEGTICRNDLLADRQPHPEVGAAKLLGGEFEKIDQLPIGHPGLFMRDPATTKQRVRL